MTRDPTSFPLTVILQVFNVQFDLQRDVVRLYLSTVPLEKGDTVALELQYTANIPAQQHGFGLYKVCLQMKYCVSLCFKPIFTGSYLYRSGAGLRVRSSVGSPSWSRWGRGWWLPASTSRPPRRCGRWRCAGRGTGPCWPTCRCCTLTQTQR